MEGLLWLLGLAVLFYFMMRYGCGAHMVHGHGHGGHEGRGAAGGGKDPVCGMQVGADAAYTRMHAGTRYWFCSKDCFEKFEADPAKYAAPGGAHGGGHGGHP
jgi:YHS domain-containing protein